MSFHMNSVCIAALLESNRSKWLYERQDVVRALLNFAAHSAGVFPHQVHVVSDSPEILDSAIILGMKGRLITSGVGTLDILPQMPSGLVLAPHRGMVSTQRVQRVLQTAKQRSKEKTVVTSPLVPPNCHPAWISAFDTLSLDGIKASVSKDVTPQPAISDQDRLDLCLGQGKVHGSQWLPNLHIPDYAVTFIQNYDPEQIVEVHDAITDYNDLPMLYRIPTFQLHASQYPDLDIYSIMQDIMEHEKAYEDGTLF